MIQVFGELKLNLPDNQTKGYWKLVRRGAYLTDKMRTDFSIATVDEISEFISKYIVEPEDTDKAMDLLGDLCKDEFSIILKAVMGGGKSTVPPQNSAPSENTTSQA